MVLELGLALALALLWTDGCRRHVWESLGPLHAFTCDCRGYRFYCRHDSMGRCFTFSHSPPPPHLRAADRSTLDAAIVELAGPKAPLTFVAAQLGDTVQCTSPLVSAVAPGDRVHQEIRIPIMAENSRHLHLYLYGKFRPYLERLIAIAKVPVDLTRIIGVHDVTVPFLNSENEPAGHIRLLLRVSPPGSPVPWGLPGGGMLYGAEPIIVFSAGGKAAIAVREDGPKGEDLYVAPERKRDEVVALEGDEERGGESLEIVEELSSAARGNHLIAGASTSGEVVCVESSLN